MNIKDSFKTYQGQAIRLRPLQAEDAEITFKWRSSDRAHLLNKGSSTVQQQAQWIASRPENEMNFIIETKNEKPVGMISLIKIDQQNKSAESARFLIGEEEAVKGIPAAVEAMLLLYCLAFEELKLNRVFGTIAEQNKLMIKWQKYLGMQQEGVLRQHYCIDNEFQNAVVMGILKDEFVQTARKKMMTLARFKI